MIDKLWDTRVRGNTSHLGYLTGAAAVHQVDDDLESFAHVLAWVAARYAPNSTEVMKQGPFFPCFWCHRPERRSNGETDIPTFLNIQNFTKAVLKLLCDLWFGFAIPLIFCHNSGRGRYPWATWDSRLDVEDHEGCPQGENWESVSHEVFELDDSLTEGRRRKSTLSECI